MAVVLAPDPELAAAYLNSILAESGLPKSAKAEDMEPFPKGRENVRILWDGDY
jgi:hypothetical protein